jgi:hypothetical protein
MVFLKDQFSLPPLRILRAFQFDDRQFFVVRMIAALSDISLTRMAGEIVRHGHSCSMSGLRVMSENVDSGIQFGLSGGHSQFTSRARALKKPWIFREERSA